MTRTLGRKKEPYRRNPRPVSGKSPAVSRWRLRASWAALFWERLWPTLWPALGFAGLYILLGLLGAPQSLPGWAHALALAVFGGAIAWAIWRGAQLLRVPDRAASVRRIETVNDLSHRPLETLEDDLATGSGDPSARALWRMHQQRMREAASRLKTGLPRPGLIRRDPFALRIALAVGLVAAVMAAGDRSMDRIAHALTPSLEIGDGQVAAKLDAWIMPPEYTRKAPVFLSSGVAAQTRTAAAAKAEESGLAAPEELATPEGSTLVVRLSGGRGAPSLSIAAQDKAFEPDGKDGFHIEDQLTESGRISVMRNSREVAGWNVTVIPDTTPSVGFSRDPSETRRKSLRLDYEATDDYGVEKIVAKITRSGALAEKSALAELPPIEMELPMPGAGLRSVKSFSFHDFTPHPWAGLPVNLQLTAHDAAGQVGKSKAVQAVLPERVFNHPVARAIIEQRRHLALYPAQNRNKVSASLEIIAWEHERYNEDVVVFMSLVAASKRLGRGYSDTPEHVAAVMRLLWDTALRVEDGTLSLSERALREAQQALLDALSKERTTDEEIERLLRELERTLNEYLDSLAESMRNMPTRPDGMAPQDRNQIVLDRSDLRKMLDQIRDLARSGQKEAARQMLSQLRNMLENMRARRFTQPGQQHRRAMRMLNELQGIVRDQQKLLDQTFREAQRRGQMRDGNQSQPFRLPRNMMPPGIQPPQGRDNQSRAPMTGESESQESLRRRLGEVMRQLGEMSGSIPRPFGRAERAMRDSTQQLGEGRAGRAVPPQTRAIDQLQQGARAATRQLMQQLGRGNRRGPGEPDADPMQRERDPFGRNTDNAGRGMNTEKVEIPEQDKLRNARRIRDELRKRAGQRQRPQDELDYIERLLRQF